MYYLHKVDNFLKEKYSMIEEKCRSRNKLYYICKSKSKSKVLIKVINKEKTEISKLQNSLSSYSLIKPHRNIINVLEAKDIDSEMLILVLEYADKGNLEEFLSVEHPEGLNDSLLFHFFYQVYRGLNYLHGIGICVKALSPKSVYVKGFTPKLGKFSDASKYHHQANFLFWAKFDAYCLGVVLYYMIFVEYPYSQGNQMIEMDLSQIDEMINRNQRKISKDLRLLLVKLLTHSEDRFELKDVEKCKWYCDNHDRYKKTINYYQKEGDEFFYNFFKFEK